MLASLFDLTPALSPDESEPPVPGLEAFSRPCNRCPRRRGGRVFPAGGNSSHLQPMQTLITAGLVLAEFGVRVMLAAVIVVRSRGTPATRLAWLVLVFAVPVEFFIS